MSRQPYTYRPPQVLPEVPGGILGSLLASMGVAEAKSRGLLPQNLTSFGSTGVNPQENLRRLRDQADYMTALSVSGASDGQLATRNLRGLFAVAGQELDPERLAALNRLTTGGMGVMANFSTGFERLHGVMDMVTGGASLANIASGTFLNTRSQIDMTGRVGLSGEATAQIAQGIHANLFMTQRMQPTRQFTVDDLRAGAQMATAFRERDFESQKAFVSRNMQDVATANFLVQRGLIYDKDLNTRISQTLRGYTDLTGTREENAARISELPRLVDLIDQGIQSGAINPAELPASRAQAAEALLNSGQLIDNLTRQFAPDAVPSQDINATIARRLGLGSEFDSEALDSLSSGFLRHFGEGADLTDEKALPDYSYRARQGLEQQLRQNVEQGQAITDAEAAGSPQLARRRAIAEASAKVLARADLPDVSLDILKSARERHLQDFSRIEAMNLSQGSFKPDFSRTGGLTSSEIRELSGELGIRGMLPNYQDSVSAVGDLGEGAVNAHFSRQSADVLSKHAKSVATLREIMVGDGMSPGSVADLMRSLEDLFDGLKQTEGSQTAKFLSQTYAAHKSLGYNAEQMTQLATMSKQIASQGGLEGAFGMHLASAGANFMSAMPDFMPMYAGRDRNQMSVLQQQMLTRGVVSPYGRLMAVAKRMVDRGAVTKDAAGDRLLEFVTLGQSGQALPDRFLKMSPEELTEMIAQGSNRSTSEVTEYSTYDYLVKETFNANPEMLATLSSKQADEMLRQVLGGGNLEDTIAADLGIRNKSASGRLASAFVAATGKLGRYVTDTSAGGEREKQLTAALRSEIDKLKSEGVDIDASDQDLISIIEKAFGRGSMLTGGERSETMIAFALEQVLKGSRASADRSNAAAAAAQANLSTNSNSMARNLINMLGDAGTKGVSTADLVARVLNLDATGERSAAALSQVSTLAETSTTRRDVKSLLDAAKASGKSPQEIQQLQDRLDSVDAAINRQVEMFHQLSAIDTELGRPPEEMPVGLDDPSTDSEPPALLNPPDRKPGQPGEGDLSSFDIIIQTLSLNGVDLGQFAAESEGRRVTKVGVT